MTTASFSRSRAWEITRPSRSASTRPCTRPSSFSSIRTRQSSLTKARLATASTASRDRRCARTAGPVELVERDRRPGLLRAGSRIAKTRVAHRHQRVLVHRLLHQLGELAGLGPAGRGRPRRPAPRAGSPARSYVPRNGATSTLGGDARRRERRRGLDAGELGEQLAVQLLRTGRACCRRSSAAPPPAPRRAAAAGTPTARSCRRRGRSAGLAVPAVAAPAEAPRARSRRRRPGAPPAARPSPPRRPRRAAACRRAPARPSGGAGRTPARPRPTAVIRPAGPTARGSPHWIAGSGSAPPSERWPTAARCSSASSGSVPVRRRPSGSSSRVRSAASQVPPVSFSTTRPASENPELQYDQVAPSGWFWAASASSST